MFFALARNPTKEVDYEKFWPSSDPELRTKGVPARGEARSRKQWTFCNGYVFGNRELGYKKCLVPDLICHALAASSFAAQAGPTIDLSERVVGFNLSRHQ
jgi:hypothetical protein